MVHGEVARACSGSFGAAGAGAGYSSTCSSGRKELTRRHVMSHSSVRFPLSPKTSDASMTKTAFFRDSSNASFY